MTLYSIALGALLFGTAWAAGGVRGYGGRFTAKRIANLRANCERLDWARDSRKSAVAAAEPYACWPSKRAVV